MKTCTKCKQDKDESDFVKKSSVKSGFAAQCKECSRAGVRKHYYANQPKYVGKALQRSRALREEARRIITERKSVPCADCGRCFPPYCMDFDHVQGVKVRAVSDMVRQISLKKLLEEIDKCAVVCAVCHRIRTFSRKHAPVA